ncbi:MAG: hypothetical protein HFJ58_00995 [Clostridia bacterium]|nr:hypothetical protein [Clostridia bacterium]
MAKTSKTLTVALKELEDQFDKAEIAIICDLALQLATNLPRNYATYLPPGKMLRLSLVPQNSESSLVKLYTATYQLVDI